MSANRPRMATDISDMELESQVVFLSKQVEMLQSRWIETDDLKEDVKRLTKEINELKNNVEPSARSNNAPANQHVPREQAQNNHARGVDKENRSKSKTNKDSQSKFTDLPLEIQAQKSIHGLQRIINELVEERERAVPMEATNAGQTTDSPVERKLQTALRNFDAAQDEIGQLKRQLDQRPASAVVDTKSEKTIRELDQAVKELREKEHYYKQQLKKFEQERNEALQYSQKCKATEEKLKNKLIEAQNEAAAYKDQADTYKSDFEEERKAREDLINKRTPVYETPRLGGGDPYTTTGRKESYDRTGFWKCRKCTKENENHRYICYSCFGAK